MASDKWKEPLIEVVDPFKLKKFAEDTGEVEIADWVFGIAECKSFLESYLTLLNELNKWSKLDEERGVAVTLAGRGEAALDDVERNARLFAAAADKCKGLNNAVKITKKKDAYQRCQKHLQNWKVAFSEEGAMLAAAIRVDQALYTKKGPMSVGTAVSQVRRLGGNWPDELEGVVRWYLETVRVKYRGDFALKKEEVSCGKCGKMKEEGEPCPVCMRAQKALEAAQAAERKGDWKTAESKAGEVREIWKDDNEAKRIQVEARKALEAIENTEKKIANALKAPNVRMAWECLEEGRGLPGFDTAKWEREIREKETEEERRKREEEERAAAAAVAEANRALQALLDSGQVKEAREKLNEVLGRKLAGFREGDWCRKLDAAERNALESDIGKALAKSPPDIESAEDKLEAGKKVPGFKTEEWRGKIEGAKKKLAFDQALLEARWADAEGMVAELVRLKAGIRDGLKGQIEKARQGHQAMLESKCGSHLDEAEKALSDWERMGDSEGAAGVLLRAKAALEAAKTARKTLEGKYPRAAALAGLARRIGAADKRLTAAESVQEVRSLRPATEVKAQGSVDGLPKVTVTWKTDDGKGAGTGWRVVRREKGKSETTVVAPCVSGSQFRDAGGGLQLGVWYEYGVTPVLGTRVGPEKLQCWTKPEGAAGCTAELAPGALSGKGEGVVGGWASVTLEWTLPPGLARGCKNMELTLQRNGGGSANVVADESMAERPGRWQDARKVSVGEEYEYTLHLKLFGKPMGSSRTRVTVKKLQPPPGVSGLVLGRTAMGEPEAQWDWPAGVESCIWGIATREPKRLSDLQPTRRYRLRRPPNGHSVVSLPDAGDGEQWMAVFGVRGQGEHTLESPPAVLCVSKTTLAYYVEGSGFFGKKTNQLVVRSTTGAFPEVEIRVGPPEEVLCREGRVFDNPRWSEAVKRAEGGWEKRCLLVGARRHEHVRLFLVHPERDNCEIAPVAFDMCKVR